MERSAAPAELMLDDKGAQGRIPIVEETTDAGKTPGVEPAVSAAELDLDAKLNQAAQDFDVALCVDLIARGASPKFVFHSGGNDWHDGDSSTCLYNAVAAFLELGRGKQKVLGDRHVNVVASLLEAGADPNFSATVGNWNRCRRHPLFQKATLSLQCLASMDFIGAGVELNKKIFFRKQGHHGGHSTADYPIFQLVKDLRRDEEALKLIEVYIECGVDVNCAQSSWSVEFGDPDNEDDEGSSKKKHQTLLHVAIDIAHTNLVKLLIAKGADVNQNVVFTHSRKFYLMSCLQLAMEVGNPGVLGELRNAGAQEAVESPLRGVVGKFTSTGDWEENVATYKDGGEGKWKAMRLKEEKAEKKHAEKKGKGKKGKKGKKKGKKR
jgi:hypothetical protein